MIWEIDIESVNVHRSRKGTECWEVTGFGYDEHGHKDNIKFYLSKNMTPPRRGETISVEADILNDCARWTILKNVSIDVRPTRTTRTGEPLMNEKMKCCSFEHRENRNLDEYTVIRFFSESRDEYFTANIFGSHILNTGHDYFVSGIVGSFTTPSGNTYYCINKPKIFGIN